MRIGIDLDNTIIDYDLSFSAAARSLSLDFPESVVSKNQIREHLRFQKNGEEIWQKLQGLAYGKFLLEHARLFQGVTRFLWRCKQKEYHVQVISHKTEYGHFDVEKIPIRKIASSFLESQNIFSGMNPLIETITFENTRQQKVNRILEKKFDWFIDDLMEVIEDISSDLQLKKILFNPLRVQVLDSVTENPMITVLSDWQQIDSLINGEWTPQEIGKLVKYLIAEVPDSIEKISKGGNSGVYKLNMKFNRSLKLKVYPVDSKHDRLHSEYLSTTVISELGDYFVPRPIAKDSSLGVGIYEWIEGEHLTEHLYEDIQESLNFLKKLHSIKGNKNFKEIQLASAACLSGIEIERQLKNRVEAFQNVRYEYPQLDSFMSREFLPLMAKLLSHAYEKWPSDSKYNRRLSMEELTLSPSDFGFHNMIRRVDGGITFLDFEYFGWDDPVKLISDFSFHPGMELTDNEIDYWLRSAVAIYGEQISLRLNICRPLYGLIWCLILLNDFRPEIWHRRILADKSKEELKCQTLNLQMEKARRLLARIKSLY